MSTPAPGRGKDHPETRLLEVEDLIVRFPIHRSIGDAIRRRPRQWVRAVDGVSMHVEAGEILALVGESGSGKSTLAQAIVGLVDASEGSIRLDGEDITTMNAHGIRSMRRQVQEVFQDPYGSLDPRFNVERTITEPLVIHGLGSPSERREKVAHALEEVGLSPPDKFLGLYPHQLSGGQRQRVAIAAGLVLGLELLIADEPVSMLDVSVRAGILGVLARLRDKGLGILMITHDLSTAAHFSDRIAVMYLGRVVEHGPTAEVLREPRHPYTKALLAAVPDPDPRLRREFRPLAGEAPDPASVPSGCRFHTRCPVAEERCKVLDPQLTPCGGSGHSAACVLVSRSELAHDTA